MPQEPRLDLPRLDAEAADLHLLVEPPEEVERPVGTEARQVARPVEPLAGLGGIAAEGVGDEALGGQVRPAEIAAGEAGAGQAELPVTPAGTGRRWVSRT